VNPAAVRDAPLEHVSRRADACRLADRVLRTQVPPSTGFEFGEFVPTSQSPIGRARPDATFTDITESAAGG
jgi:hypothetical protein